MSLFSESKFEQAQDWFEQSLKTGHAQPSRCHNAIGLCLAACQEHEKAEEAFTEAIRVDGSNARALHNRAKVRATLQKHDVAKADAELSAKLLARQHQ